SAGRLAHPGTLFRPRRLRGSPVGRPRAGYPLAGPPWLPAAHEHPARCLCADGRRRGSTLARAARVAARGARPRVRSAPVSPTPEARYDPAQWRGLGQHEEDALPRELLDNIAVVETLKFIESREKATIFV